MSEASIPQSPGSIPASIGSGPVGEAPVNDVLSRPVLPLELREMPAGMPACAGKSMGAALDAAAPPRPWRACGGDQAANFSPSDASMTLKMSSTQAWMCCLRAVCA